MTDTWELIIMTNKIKFNDTAQKGRIRVASDSSYAYTQNQDVASAA